MGNAWPEFRVDGIAYERGIGCSQRQAAAGLYCGVLYHFNAAHLHMEALFLVSAVFEAYIDLEAPLLALGLDVVVDFRGAAGDAAGAGADQHGGDLLAPLQGVPGVGLKHMAAVPGHFPRLIRQRPPFSEYLPAAPEPPPASCSSGPHRRWS